MRTMFNFLKLTSLQGGKINAWILTKVLTIIPPKKKVQKNLLLINKILRKNLKLTKRPNTYNIKGIILKVSRITTLMLKVMLQAKINMENLNGGDEFMFYLNHIYLNVFIINNVNKIDLF